MEINMAKNDLTDKIKESQSTGSANNPEDFVMRENTSRSAAKCDVKCQQCGEKRRMAWKPGMKCPVCNSNQFQPVIKVDVIEEKEVAKQKNIKLSTKKLNINFKKINFKKYLGLILGIFLLGVWVKIGFIVLKDNFKKQDSLNQTLKWQYACSHCGHTFTDLPKIPPVECPLCGNKKAYITFECLDCKKTFTLKDKSKVPLCVYCSSSRIKSYYPSNKQVKK